MDGLDRTKKFVNVASRIKMDDYKTQRFIRKVEKLCLVACHFENMRCLRVVIAAGPLLITSSASSSPLSPIFLPLYSGVLLSNTMCAHTLVSQVTANNRKSPIYDTSRKLFVLHNKIFLCQCMKEHARDWEQIIHGIELPKTPVIGHQIL